MLQVSKISYLGLTQPAPTPTAFERFLTFLDAQMTEPAIYGWFHFLFIFLTVLACVIVCFTCKKVSQKQVKTVLGCVAGALLFLELYKQLNFAYDAETGEWAYAWSAFPFQFCSTPMYIMLLAAFSKKEKLQNALYCFLATYGLFAGVLVMLYPGGVFTETIGINIQTMLHHGTMIVIGVFLYATKSVKMQHKTVVYGAPVFAALLLTALILNAVFAALGDPDANFNMFYLARTGKTPLDFLDTLFTLIPYPIIWAGYIGGFTGMGWAMSALAMLTVKIYRYYRPEQKESTNEQKDKNQEKLTESKLT